MNPALSDPDLIRTWLFGPGADGEAHEAMLASGSDALIIDLEDFTQASRREQARSLLPRLLARARAGGMVSSVRINSLESDGPLDLAAAMSAGAEVISYPMASSGQQMHALHAAITHWESRLDIPVGATNILPVCETALGVAEVRAIAAASPRICCALLGTEDLAADLCAERHPDGIELDYARRRFILECRAAGIEPIDSPYTYGDVDGAVAEAAFARRLGYRSKSLVLPAHARQLNTVFTPGEDETRRARAIVQAFEAARARGEDRALVDGLWVEVPTFRNAMRVLARANRLAQRISLR